MVGSAGTRQPAESRSQACRRACPAHDAGVHLRPRHAPPTASRPCAYAGGGAKGRFESAVCFRHGLYNPSPSCAGATRAVPMESCQPPTASTRAQVDVYRRLSHGVAPPPSVWDQAVGSVSTTPVCSSAALLSQEATWDADLLARMRARQRELAVPPPNLPTPVLQAVAIERQLPGLLQLQRRVWSEVVGHTDGTDLCTEATDSLSLRRRQRQRQPREVRESERLERQRRIDAVRRIPTWRRLWGDYADAIAV
jgi:hypothetical protein